MFNVKEYLFSYISEINNASILLFLTFAKKIIKLNGLPCLNSSMVHI